MVAESIVAKMQTKGTYPKTLCSIMDSRLPVVSQNCM
jgi:hypothetical protein